MALAKTRSVALVGVEGFVVDVEASITSGVPGLHLVGLPDAALNEARDRVRAAIFNSGESWPNRHVTISLFPASLPKKGSAFDLAIAVSLLAAAETFDPRACTKMVILGELGLDGRVRAVPGVLPAVLAAANAGYRTVVVPRSNVAEAELVPDVEVIAASSLHGLLCRLRGQAPPPEPEDAETARLTPVSEGAAIRSRDLRGDLDLTDVRGQAEARRALEISAAGGHHLFFYGPPGCGKTMLAERLPTLLPPLDREAALEVTAIHSVAGTLPPGKPLISRPPFCAPHHTATRAAMVGSGQGRLLQPGAASLAHHGILFLDEAPEFNAGVLDALRQPLEEGEVMIARAGAATRFPARFTLVLAANPCPCAAAKSVDCTCTPAVRHKYLARISGPLLDRIDLKLELHPATRAELRYDLQTAERSEVVAERVLQARERAAKRLAGTPWRTNAEIPGPQLRRRFLPSAEAMSCLDRALQTGELSARGLDRVLRTAWTCADLAGRDTPSADDLSSAFALWTGRRC
ncbi:MULTISPECIES: YifB family Mg chelatase-like AAA ATPase [Thermomonospora]|uniref:Mg chelatase, subunit ChlI n=1 Tax=Thermomonospora curvata (strain ATCC 19995 / DSM 43183 / JCM 3096 / KCTC 9072 / NBRC 15933 / NCIMB 10081 / Henssen B9) TaxID=471852 RepID=D1AB09_THECD|nr:MULTISPECIES: YifB family Mg chelatase-like AAA ATPase [Thermomonospora]ACY98952.1 Mg chelatase, subunit ChlI [Thermomonospora curvata DSM 43183]PKK13147.1 MAG: ATP-binding protein [Thermomonospora sp. CIF 1]